MRRIRLLIGVLLFGALPLGGLSACQSAPEVTAPTFCWVKKMTTNCTATITRTNFAVAAATTLSMAATRATCWKVELVTIRSTVA